MDNRKHLVAISSEGKMANIQLSSINIDGLIGDFGNSDNVGAKDYLNFGASNDIPNRITEIMNRNNLAPGILEREIGLVWGSGARLYREIYQNGAIEREWLADTEVQKFLDSIDYKRFLRSALVEYKYMKGFYVTFAKSRDRKKIVKISFYPNSRGRLGYCESGMLADVKDILIGNWNLPASKAISYPRNRDKAIFADYFCGESFGCNNYALPSYWGSLEWIERSSDVPRIIKFLTENSISAIFHVHSPESYWSEIKQNLIEKHPTYTNEQINAELKKIETESLNTLSTTLAGKENTGKYIHTQDVTDHNGNVVGWKIEPINQQIDTLIEAHLKVSEKADSAVTSGIGLPPCLANVIINGQLSSGSQLIYAYKLYLASDVELVEDIVTAPINEAIAYNFPTKDIKVGFYRPVVLTEENTTSSNRIANTI